MLCTNPGIKGKVCPPPPVPADWGRYFPWALGGAVGGALLPSWESHRCQSNSGQSWLELSSCHHFHFTDGEAETRPGAPRLIWSPNCLGRWAAFFPSRHWRRSDCPEARGGDTRRTRSGRPNPAPRNPRTRILSAVAITRSSRVHCHFPFLLKRGEPSLHCSRERARVVQVGDAQTIPDAQPRGRCILGQSRGAGANTRWVT